MVGGEGEVGRGDKVHLGGLLHYFGGGFIDLSDGQRRGVDRHED